MKLRDQVVYMNRPAWIIGIRQPRSDERSKFYTLTRKPNTAKADYYDVPEKHIIPCAIFETAVIERIYSIPRLVK